MFHNIGELFMNLNFKKLTLIFILPFLIAGCGKCKETEKDIYSHENSRLTQVQNPVNREVSSWTFKQKGDFIYFIHPNKKVRVIRISEVRHIGHYSSDLNFYYGPRDELIIRPISYSDYISFLDFLGGYLENQPKGPCGVKGEETSQQPLEDLNQQINNVYCSSEGKSQ